MTYTSTVEKEPIKRFLSLLFWMNIIRGILLILFAIVLITQPGATLLTLIQFLGIFWLVDGVFSILEGLRGKSKESRLRLITSGVLGILGGFLILGNSLLIGVFTGLVITTIIGAMFIANGVTILFTRDSETKRIWRIALGALYITLGGILALNPLFTVNLVRWLVFIWAIASGFVSILLAFNIHQLKGKASEFKDKVS